MFLLLFNILFVICSVLCKPPIRQPAPNRCLDILNKECNHKTKFTEQEVENARIYIQNRFLGLTKYKPTAPPCKKLHVRREFKCLSHKERVSLMAVINQLYDDGTIEEMAAVHKKYWGETHKFSDFLMWHRWFMNQFELKMREIDGSVTLPYWIAYDEFDNPQESLIWDYIGHAGTKSNGYCLTDGAFAHWSKCVRRQWSNDLTIPNFNPIEFQDSGLQTIQTWAQMRRCVNAMHFKTHLNVGGWAGQMSVTDAPHDPLFNIFHDYLIDILVFRWQLQNDDNLIPESYNNGNIYDWETKLIRQANLTRDRIIHYNVSILDTFQIGFGEQCYTHDLHIIAINQILKNERDPIPFSYSGLPVDLAKLYYPKFYTEEYTPFDFISHPVVNCNTKCHPIRPVLNYSQTANGRRQVDGFKYDTGYDITQSTGDSEKANNDFISDMNSAAYCSPYIIS